MLTQSAIDRDVQRESAQNFTYQGYVFPKYEGRLTDDEFKSKQTYFSFWGGKHLTKPAIRYQVSLMLERGLIPKLAA